jgi:hypothetical protein
MSPTARYPGLNQIADPTLQRVLKVLFDKVVTIETQHVPQIGAVTAPLTVPLDANAQQLKALADPTHAQDAVTLQYLQHYVESRVQSTVRAAIAAAVATIPGAPGGPPPPIGTLPPLAPNELAVLQTVYASATWDFSTDQGPTGRGAFIDLAVPALNAVDANFGHVNKNPGQTQYNGHAVDAINWKDPDNLTAEIYDVISSGGALQWNFVDRTSANLSKWRYP